jgi:spore germination protein GerM
MKNKFIWIFLIVLFFLAGAAGSYFFSARSDRTEKPAAGVTVENLPIVTEDLFSVRIYYPSDTRIEMFEKRSPKRTKPSSVAEAVIEEFFKGAPGNRSLFMPQDVKLLGLYTDSSHILYIDLSDEFRRNFQGDALSEYLILKGLYESLISNLQDYQDFKILVEGKELETLGGHIYLKYPLKNLVAYEFKGNSKAESE